MKTKYTRHAKRRMKWRKISELEAKGVLINPDRIIKSKTDRKIKVRKTIKRKLIEVVYVVENNQIIIISVVNKKD